jgi:hypothetical protein
MGIFYIKPDDLIVIGVGAIEVTFGPVYTGTAEIGIAVLRLEFDCLR